MCDLLFVKAFCELSLNILSKEKLGYFLFLKNT